MGIHMGYVGLTGYGPATLGLRSTYSRWASPG
jgi:hypothetical protein